MKHITMVTLILLAFALPAAAGSVPEATMTPEMVAEAATESTTAKLDGLMLFIAYALFLAVAGGAF